MDGECAIEHVIGAQSRTRPDDRAIAALAGRQHGVVARTQLLELGIGRGAIRHRTDSGRLHRVHSGVFSVGHRVLSMQGRWMAAVLAAGPGAILSHRSAAALWQIRRSAGPQIELTAARRLHPRPGLRPHCAVLPDDETTTKDDIPVTTPARTLLDLAAVLSPQALERAAHEAEIRRLAGTLSLDALLARHRGARGAMALRHILATTRLGTTITLSHLEDVFLPFLRNHGLPRPDTNILIEGKAVDIAWREQRLIVELDGYGTHGTRQAFEDDRARDRRHQAAGWRVIRITWRQLHEDQRTLAQELRQLLLTTPSGPALNEGVDEHHPHPGPPSMKVLTFDESD